VYLVFEIQSLSLSINGFTGKNRETHMYVCMIVCKVVCMVVCMVVCLVIRFIFYLFVLVLLLVLISFLFFSFNLVWFVNVLTCRV